MCPSNKMISYYAVSEFPPQSTYQENQTVLQTCMCHSLSLLQCISPMLPKACSIAITKINSMPMHDYSKPTSKGK